MTAFAALTTALSASDTQTRLDAAWEALDIGRQAADAITWHDAYDEVQALAAGQEAVAGRALLPLPASGDPVPLPANTPPAQTASLLDQAAAVLRQLGATTFVDADSLRQAAQHAAAAARCLRAAQGAA